ncbi:unnamed protein product [Mytilus edulis]|uniref:Ankyrin repeat protein n=1 Tax=Mytilus edulis TaxID=6550 RepID=A0A8S3TLU5_MYTED|nr:unnamed protein product [Mytilus edulis]
MLQDDASFVSYLLKEFAMCIMVDELELRYQKKCVKVSFYFPAALLHFMSGKDRIDNTMAAAIDSLEGVVKGKENLEIYDACSNILLSTFSWLMQRDEVDIIFRQILEIIEECNIDCDFNIFIHGAIESGNRYTCSFVLKRLSHKIDILELVMTVADKNLSNCHSIACDSFNIKKSSCTDRVEIVSRLLKETPKDTFDLNSVLMSAISYKIESVLIWLLGTFPNLKFDTNVIINSAYKNGWNNVLMLLLDMDICNMNSGNLILSEACSRGCLIIVKYALQNVDHTVFDMKTAMENACDYDRPDIVKYLIENVDLTLFDMKTLVNTVFF